MATSSTVTLEPFKELGPDSKRAKKPLPLYLHSVNYADKLVRTRRRALSITKINSHQEPVRVKPATLLIPIDLFCFIVLEEFFGTQYQRSSFS